MNDRDAVQEGNLEKRHRDIQEEMLERQQLRSMLLGPQEKVVEEASQSAREEAGVGVYENGMPFIRRNVQNLGGILKTSQYIADFEATQAVSHGLSPENTGVHHPHSPTNEPAPTSRNNRPESSIPSINTSSLHTRTSSTESDDNGGFKKVPISHGIAASPTSRTSKSLSSPYALVRPSSEEPLLGIDPITLGSPLQFPKPRPSPSFKTQLRSRRVSNDADTMPITSGPFGDPQVSEETSRKQIEKLLERVRLDQQYLDGYEQRIEDLEKENGKLWEENRKYSNLEDLPEAYETLMQKLEACENDNRRLEVDKEELNSALILARQARELPDNTIQAELRKREEQLREIQDVLVKEREELNIVRGENKMTLSSIDAIKKEREESHHIEKMKTDIINNLRAKLGLAPLSSREQLEVGESGLSLTDETSINKDLQNRKSGPVCLNPTVLLDNGNLKARIYAVENQLKEVESTIDNYYKTTDEKNKLINDWNLATTLKQPLLYKVKDLISVVVSRQLKAPKVVPGIMHEGKSNQIQAEEAMNKAINDANKQRDKAIEENKRTQENLALYESQFVELYRYVRANSVAVLKYGVAKQEMMRLRSRDGELKKAINKLILAIEQPEDAVVLQATSTKDQPSATRNFSNDTSDPDNSNHARTLDLPARDDSGKPSKSQKNRLERQSPRYSSRGVENSSDYIHLSLVDFKARSTSPEYTIELPGPRFNAWGNLRRSDAKDSPARANFPSVNPVKSISVSRFSKTQEDNMSWRTKYSSQNLRTSCEMSYWSNFLVLSMIVWVIFMAFAVFDGHRERRLWLEANGGQAPPGVLVYARAWDFNPLLHGMKSILTLFMDISKYAHQSPRHYG